MFPYIMLSTLLALTSLLSWADVDRVAVADVDDACDIDEVAIDDVEDGCGVDMI